MATVIEFAHRSMTGIDTVLILALLAWTFHVFPKNHAARLGAAISTVFLVTEALIGAALVKFGLVVNDASAGRAAVLSLHLTNTLTLLACLTLTAWWAGNHSRIRLAWKAWVSLGAVVLLGITGALAALADTLYPVHSLVAGFSQDLNPGANLSIKLRVIHPILAAAVGIWPICYATSRSSTAHQWAQTVIAIVAAQVLAGAVNLLELVPIGMQLVHLLFADLLWVALVVLCWHPESVQPPHPLQG
jgi:heme A synthase